MSLSQFAWACKMQHYHGFTQFLLNMGIKLSKNFSKLQSWVKSDMKHDTIQKVLQTINGTQK